MPSPIHSTIQFISTSAISSAGGLFCLKSLGVPGPAWAIAGLSALPTAPSSIALIGCSYLEQRGHLKEGRALLIGSLTSYITAIACVIAFTVLNIAPLKIAIIMVIPTVLLGIVYFGVYLIKPNKRVTTDSKINQLIDRLVIKLKNKVEDPVQEAQRLQVLLKAQEAKRFQTTEKIAQFTDLYTTYPLSAQK